MKTVLCLYRIGDKMDIEEWRREIKIRDENESDYSICMKCGVYVDPGEYHCCTNEDDSETP